MTAQGIWRLTVRSDFAAAHALRHYCGKCENMHGHNFAVEAVVEGSTLTPDTELVLDFKVLKHALADVLALLDHTMLNDVPPFDERNPSSENLARFIYRHLAKRLAQAPDGAIPHAQDTRGVRVYSVTVSEKAAQSATYMER